MKYTLLLFCIVLIVFVATQTTLFRFLKTIYLIVISTPYERTIQSAPKILVLGDSTGYGTGASKNTDTIAGRIGTDFTSYSIENKSKNGRTIGELVDVAKKVEGKYELILLQIGGNDILQKKDVREVEKQLQEIVVALSDNTNNLLMMSSGNVGGASAFKADEAVFYEGLTRTYREMFLRVAAETQLTYIDLFLEPEVDVISQNPKKYLAIDGLHPSSEGYGVWYTTLKPVLEKILK